MIEQGTGALAARKCIFMRSFYPLLRLQGESPPGSSACIERICREAGGGSLHACFSGQLPLFIRWYSTPAVRPNNAFKPNALPYHHHTARKAFPSFSSPNPHTDKPP